MHAFTERQEHQPAVVARRPRRCTSSRTATAFPNLYRVALSTRRGHAAHQRRTGLSGITSSSPALSVASRAGDRRVQRLRRRQLRHPHARRGGRPSAAPRAGCRRHRRRRCCRRSIDGRATSRRCSRTPTSGCRRAGSASDEPDTQPKLALEAVGQPTLRSGSSRFGAAVGGGISLRSATCSAITRSHGRAVQLGHHRQLQHQEHRRRRSPISTRRTAGTGASSAAGAVSERRVRRAVSARSTVSRSLIDQNDPLSADRTERRRHRRLSVQPRAARRIQGGVTQISFDQIVQTTAYSLHTGSAVLRRHTTETSLAPSLTLGTPRPRCVYDTSNFGATSPVQGQRYRSKPRRPSARSTTPACSADYRRYFMPVPFYTIATRVLHYGRYG